MEILLVGATGFIGQKLIKHLSKEGHITSVCGRKNSPQKNLVNPQKWLDFESLEPSDLNSFDAIINLSGAPILGKRWTDEYKAELIQSRVDITKKLSHLAVLCERPPKIWIQASAVGIYPNSGGPYDESSKQGHDFLAHLCEQGEAASDELENASCHIRVIELRLGVVLSLQGGALSKMVPDFRSWLGGVIGSGKQMISWIHIEDLCQMVSWMLVTPSLNGAFNATSPSPVTQKVFAHTLAKALKKPCLFHLPVFLMDLVLGESSTLVTKGSAVLPQKALKYGFEFKFRDISQALDHLIKTST
jgi:uncharacterized protein (TIGR01777 family)